MNSVRLQAMAEVVPGSQENLRRAADLLRAGELVCFPTETVYGVAADASNSRAVGRIFQAKGRPADHPLIVHLPSPAVLDDWADEVPEQARSLARHFWPGPLTIVLRRGRRVPLEVTGGQDTVAVRVPAHPLALELLALFGGALVAPSANRFGRISPTRPEHALAELGDEVALVVDGGASSIGVESTIVDLSGAIPRLLRPGAVSRDRLAEVLGASPVSAEDHDGPRAPGRLASHYAPSSPTRLVTGDSLEEELLRDAAVSVVARRPPPGEFRGRWLSLPSDPEGYARELYSALRELDGVGYPIVIEEPPQTPEWEAVNDRLGRAAGPLRR